MIHNRPRASKRIWIGLTTPSFSDAKRLTSKPSATWNEASSAAGSSGSAANAQVPNIKHQRPKNLHIPNSNTRLDDLTRRRDGRSLELGAFICSLRKLVRQFGYIPLLHFYERHKLFHFRRKPANARIAMIAAAGLRRPVAAEERPVLRAPVIEPEPVLCHDSLTETFERRVGPGTVLVRLARVIGEFTETELPGTDARHPCMTARRELKAVFGQVWLAVSRAAEGGEHVHKRQVALTRQSANGFGVFGQVRVAQGKIGQQPAALLERRRRDQHQSRCLPGALVEESPVITDEGGRPSASTQRFAAVEMQHNNRSSRPSKMFVEGRKTDVARLGMDRVTFPAEIAEMHIEAAIPDREQRFQVAGMLCRLDIRCANESDDVAPFQNETPSGKRLALCIRPVGCFHGRVFSRRCKVG